MSMLKDQLIKEHGWAVESLEERKKELKAKRKEYVENSDPKLEGKLMYEIEQLERRKYFDAGILHAYESLMSVLEMENKEG